MVQYKQWKLLLDCASRNLGLASLVEKDDPKEAAKLRKEAAKLQGKADDLQKEGIDFSR